MPSWLRARYGRAAIVGAFYSGDDGEVCTFDAEGEDGGGDGARLNRALSFPKGAR